MKLAAGTTSWTKLIDLPSVGSDDCHDLANDDVGHLVILCSHSLLRRKI